MIAGNVQVMVIPSNNFERPASRSRARAAAFSSFQVFCPRARIASFARDCGRSAIARALAQGRRPMAGRDELCYPQGVVAMLAPPGHGQGASAEAAYVSFSGTSGTTLSSRTIGLSRYTAARIQYAAISSNN